MSCIEQKQNLKKAVYACVCGKNQQKNFRIFPTIANLKNEQNPLIGLLRKKFFFRWLFLSYMSYGTLFEMLRVKRREKKQESERGGESKRGGRQRTRAGKGRIKTTSIDPEKYKRAVNVHPAKALRITALNRINYMLHLDAWENVSNTSAKYYACFVLDMRL